MNLTGKSPTPSYSNRENKIIVSKAKHSFTLKLHRAIIDKIKKRLQSI
jgi:hypothetical protein